jgi:hypothetical protein
VTATVCLPKVARSGVAQWQRERLLIARLWVRVPPPELSSNSAKFENLSDGPVYSRRAHQSLDKLRGSDPAALTGGPLGKASNPRANRRVTKHLLDRVS